jgi:NNP family nitrate/nitrite transporter-like MFS transporter
VAIAFFLGLGTGGVFAWVAKAAPAERVGSVTGLVGAAGGLGGYFPPLVLGATYDKLLPQYGVGLVLLAVVAASALVFSQVGIKGSDRSARHG